MSNGAESPTGDRGTSAYERGTSTAPHQMAAVASDTEDAALFPCNSVSVLTSGLPLRFDPPSTTGTTVVEATVDVSSLIGDMRWCRANVDGFRGTVDVDSVVVVGSRSRAALRARHPGKLRLRFQRGDCSRSARPPTCFANVDMSVPHFFFLSLGRAFDNDLARIGLMRRANSDRSPLTLEQNLANQRVRNAVIAAALRALTANYEGINVRFMRTSPRVLVGGSNFTTVNIGGMSPPDAEEVYGATVVDPTDLYNPDKPVLVCAGEFGRRTTPVASDSLYLAIFDPLATEDGDGRPLGGSPVNARDFFVGYPTQRELHVRAAVIAFGNFLGMIISHECAHVLYPYGLHERGSLMQAGGETFEQLTGIVAFNPRNLTLRVRPTIAFGPRYREILPAMYPTGAIFGSAFD